jgi:hypothetical protein
MTKPTEAIRASLNDPKKPVRAVKIGKRLEEKSFLREREKSLGVREVNLAAEKYS